MTNRIQWCRAARLLLILLLPATFAAQSGRLAADQGQESSPISSDESVIRELGSKYVDAFNQRDAKALAEFWSPDAVYTNRQTGQQVTGRQAIAQQFVELFAGGEEFKLEVAVDSIDFLSPNVAIEKGVAVYVAGQPESIPYSAVYVKRDGTWLLDRVTDDPQPVVMTHYDQLKPLEWMVGSWVDQHEGGAIQSECNWTKNKNFLTRTFKVDIQGQIDLSGMQIIGWDAGEKRVRSWTFDSDGGFAQGQWSNNGDQWYVIKKGTTADGKAVSAVNVITLMDDDSFSLKSVQRTVDGRLLPDIDEVMVVRQ